MTAPVVGLAEAAKITGKSESTLRRKRSELLEAGAKRTDKGGWEIPIPVLVQLGLMPATTAPDGPPAPAVEASMTASTQTPSDSVTAPLTAELERLRAELAEERQARAVAEAVNKERERLLESYRETINVQAQALRMVEPARPTPAAEPAKETPSEPATQEVAPPVAAPKKRWWRR